MPITRRSFSKGIMDKDTDERLLGEGFYRHAENVAVTNSESSEVGTVQNALSNRKLTDLKLGNNAVCLGKYEDEYRDKIYWLIKSDNGCYLIEWDNPTQTVWFVLKDTRPLATRVFSLDEKFYCTGFEKIINETIDKDLILITDDNLEPLLINVERAKGYGENGFDIEDICLIKKPPRYAPKTLLTYNNSLSNNIEEKFILFAYRYQYLDGEWSALSCFTNYKFSPNKYSIDYYTLDNLGMVNGFNAVDIRIDTGDKRVKTIQVVAKESNTNNLFIVETFHKKIEGMTDSVPYTFQFANNKIYAQLPSIELYRSFDAVPRKAKALTLVGNRAVFGNYLEGYDIKNADKEKYRISYAVSLESSDVNKNKAFTKTIADSYFYISTTNIVLTKEAKITFRFVVKNISHPDLSGGVENIVFDKNFQYILSDSYASLDIMFQSLDFKAFVEAVNLNFQANYAVNFPNTWNKVTDAKIEMVNTNGNYGFVFLPAVYTAGKNTKKINFKFDSGASYAIYDLVGVSSSCKSNRDYEFGIIYLDKFGRKTIVLTALHNTFYIPNENSQNQNKFIIKVLSEAPYWADRYKIVVKSQPLSYYTITVNTYYKDGAFVWVKLEGSDKDKVKQGDYLILKKTPEKLQNAIIKTKILEIVEKEKDFISDNPTKEPAGLYMKIKPTGFNMNVTDVQTNSSYNRAESNTNSFYPTTRLNLFSSSSIPSVHKTFNAGSVIKLRFESGFDGDVKKFEKEYICLRNYIDFEDFFNENILGRNLYCYDGNGNTIGDYKGNVKISKGLFFPNPNEEMFLNVKGLYDGTTDFFGFSKSGTIDCWLEFRTSTGDFIFETEPKKSIEAELFYETEQTFEIVNGNHLANRQNQNNLTGAPALIELDFFNCYSQGNGVESYMIKDGFNKPFLNIDSRPSTTSTEEYKEVRRYADMNYGEAYIESSNSNRLNEFNLSTAPYKELDKQYGSIQRLILRDSDIAVFQEEKISKVMFGKDALYNGDGNINVTSIKEVLGQNVMYLGENGIGKNPESIAIDDYRIYFTNIQRGIIQRLSIDGITNISGGMIDWFRDLSISHPNGRKFGCFDPYSKQYMLTIENEPDVCLVTNCGTTLDKVDVKEPFKYIFRVDDKRGIVVLSYNITSGFATITAVFNGVTSVVSNVTGLGTLDIDRDTLDSDEILVTITPISGSITYNLTNLCPVGYRNHYSGKHYNKNHYST